MTRLPTLRIALLLATVSGTASAQIFHLREPSVRDQWTFGMSGFGGFPVGEFHQNEDGGAGGDLTVGFQPFRREPLVLRGSAGLLMYGYYDRNVDRDVCDAFGNCTTETVYYNSRYHTMSFFQIGPELMATDGKYRPFAFAMVGRTLFNSWADVGDPYTTDVNHGLFFSNNFSTAYGGGLRIVKQGFGREQGLELGVRFTRNAKARYVTDRGVYQRSDGSWDVSPISGAANVLGIHVGYWMGPYINWNERRSR